MKTEQQFHREALFTGLNLIVNITDRLILFDAHLRQGRSTAKELDVLSKALDDFKLVMELIEELNHFYQPNKLDFTYLSHEFDYWPKKVMVDLQVILQLVESYDWNLLSRLLNQSISRDIEAYAHFIRTFLSLIPVQIAAVS